MKIKSITKINLGLRVKEKRPDGFHNLETVFYPLRDIFDELTFEKSGRTVFSSNSDLPFDENNLIYKAIKKLEKLSGRTISVKITLNKKIPMGAGLGGGSSNAAATLLAINELFDLKIDAAALKKAALELGSDVPFFLYSKPAFAELRGEKLTPLDIKINGDILLVNPGIHVSTKEAFESLKPNSENLPNLDEITEAISGGFNNASKIIVNDFERTVFEKYPEIKKIKNGLLEFGAKFALMTGTGSTVYGIFEKKDDIDKAYSHFSKSNYLTFISTEHGL